MFNDIKVLDIDLHLVSVDKNQITFTNAKTYRDYLDMNYVSGKNKLKYNVLCVTLFFNTVNNGYKSKLYKCIVTKGNMNDGYKLVFDENINNFSQLAVLFKKHKVKEELNG